MALDKPLAAYETVETWRTGLRDQWGEEPDMTERLRALEGFCEMVGKDPDTIIAECSRVVEGGKRIRIKGRREYAARIAEFQESEDGDARAQGRLGNNIRSFFIHNGIFMQAGLSS
ncbi:MAG: hypothetical protein WD904_09885 [Dehalococcoidia bacterium]